MDHMLERYFVKPSTVDRIRASWLALQIERYHVGDTVVST
jgi:hypothetical protein